MNQTKELTTTPTQPWNPHQLPIPPQEEVDSTPKTALCYWYYKTRGPSSWNQGEAINEHGARCLGSVIGMLYFGTPFSLYLVVNKVDKELVSRAGSLSIPQYNDHPATDFTDILNLCRTLEI